MNWGGEHGSIPSKITHFHIENFGSNVLPTIPNSLCYVMVRFSVRQRNLSLYFRFLDFHHSKKLCCEQKHIYCKRIIKIWGTVCFKFFSCHLCIFGFHRCMTHHRRVSVIFLLAFHLRSTLKLAKFSALIRFHHFQKHVRFYRTCFSKRASC